METPIARIYYDKDGGMPELELYTIQRTGTRFANNFLQKIGVPYIQRHAPLTTLGKRQILTVRNPYDCYRTWARVSNGDFDSKFLDIWREYVKLDGFFFTLDCNDRVGMLSHCMEYCGLEPDLPLIEAFPWDKVGSTGVGGSVPPEMVKTLAFAYEWYLDKI